MPDLTIRGTVSLEGGEFAVAGVTVLAFMPAEAVADKHTSARDDRIQLGRAVTDSDGSFAIETGDDPLVSRCACVLKNCSDFKFRLACFDQDEALLHESEPLSYTEDAMISIALPEGDFAPERRDWEELSRRMMESQTVRIGNVATELATLAPGGVFKDWSVTRRLGMLSRIEQALLDPESKFVEAGMRMRFWRLTDEAEVLSLRQELRRRERGDLVEALEVPVSRARAFGDLVGVDAFVDADAFGHGDVVGGVNGFLGEGPVFFPGGYGWLSEPLTGYRDYLRDRWISSQPGLQPYQISPATLLERLNNRFHQDFATKSTTGQPANRVLVRILLKALTAPAGTGYGFGIAPAAIDPQGERSHREYLDYLISLTGMAIHELENRYRVNLKRSDLELSSPVQQNIDTLQRFFTDSYQSVDDPLAIKPDRVAGIEEPLIVTFPEQGAGPFFLEYEEWLERDEPFYPENHFDIRETFSWKAADREKVNTNSIPLGEFINLKPETSKYDPDSAGYDHHAMKVQWVRNFLDLQDIIVAAHDALKSLNYPVAEQKYGDALKAAEKLRTFIHPLPVGWWGYDPAATAKAQKNFQVGDMNKLTQFEGQYHAELGPLSYLQYTGSPPDITEKWWDGNKAKIPYVLDFLTFRYLPACLSEARLALGKYADAVRQLIEPASFDVFTARTTSVAWTYKLDPGPLPFATSSDRSKVFIKYPATKAATNKAELGFFKLKLGNAALEWADVLYRSNQPENIMRARELYKGVIFLHGEDPEITPHWGREFFLPGPWFSKSKRNPAVVSQVNRARIGFVQINAGLNYYGFAPNHVPPVRYRVLKEAAERFAAGAKGAQSDFLGYMQQLDQLIVSEMTTRTMVDKANAAISIAKEQQKIVEFHVGEVQKQVDAINAQIAAKQAEIAKADEVFEQYKEFGKGMKDSVGKLAEIAFAGEAEPGPAQAQNVSIGDVLKLAMKLGGSPDIGGATQALGSGGATATAFGAFLYAGVSSISSMADAAAKRAGELKQLKEVALPAAKALVELKQREVTIAGLHQKIALAEWQLGKDLLTHYATRLQNRAFLVNMAEFSNRLMRRYLDLAGKTAWLAERALAFEQDRELSIIKFDYFPRNLRGVSGADLLQLHLAELEAARIQGLTQTIPVKHTVSLARDFPVQFGQLKKAGACRFMTAELPLRLVYPGVYGYRVRNITIAATYAEPIQPHRGLLSNQGVSLVTRDKLGTAHTLVRYPDALPLSEFRMRNDMWVFDLPDETLLPFEGSGIETIWELNLSKIGNANGFQSMTDMLITFDMRASYSAFLEKEHIAALPNSANRSLLVSGKAMNPGAIANFRQAGGQLKLAFDLAKLARNANETQRKTLNLMFLAVGVDAAGFNATVSSANPAQSKAIAFKDGMALSNAGPLAPGNAGVPLPLNAFVGLDVDQKFTLAIDAAANAATNFKNLSDVLLLAEYEATF